MVVLQDFDEREESDLNHRILQWLMVLVIVVLAGYTWVSYTSSSGDTIHQGSSAIGFHLKTLGGTDLSLSDYKNKGVILNFWGTFCKPCREEMPALESQYQKYKDKGVVVIGIDASEVQNTVGAYVKELGIHFPIVLDPGLEIGNIYQANELPYSVFIKPDGHIAHIHIGQMDEKTIDKYVTSVLPK
jgi:peroxiredoxin